MPQPPKTLQPGRSARDWSGAELRHWRTLRHLSQDQLGLLVHVSGDLIAKVEKADRQCPPKLAESLDSVLDTGGVLTRHLELVTAEAERRRRDADNLTLDADSPASPTAFGRGQPHDSGMLSPSEQVSHKATEASRRRDQNGPRTGAEGDEEVRLLCRTADGRIIVVTLPRRALLRGGVAATGLLTTSPSTTHQPVQELSGSVHLPDANPVLNLQRLRRALVECDNLFGSARVIVTVREHVALIQRLRTESSGADRIAFLRLQAEYAEFCGWLYQDSGDHRSAQYWTDRSLDWSHATGDRELIAYIMVRKAQLAGDMRDAMGAVDLAEAVDHLAVSSSRLQAMGAMYGAHGHALIGDVKMCKRGYDRALGLVENDWDDASGRRGSWLDATYVEAQRAYSLSLLGDQRAAVDGFDRAVCALPSTYRRDRGVYLTRAALAHARMGDPEQAVMVVSQALPVAAETGSARILTEMAALDALLRPWSTVPEVIGFRQSLDRLVVHEAASAPSPL